MVEELPKTKLTTYVFGENGAVVGHATLAAQVEVPGPLKLRHRYALLWAWVIAGPLNPVLAYWANPYAGGHFGADLMGTWMLIGLPSAFGAGMVALRLRKGAVSLRRIIASSIAYAVLAIPVTLILMGALGAMVLSIQRNESSLTIAFAALKGAGEGALMTFVLPLLFYGAGMLLALAFAIPAGIACALVFRLIAFKRIAPASRLPKPGTGSA